MGRAFEVRKKAMAETNAFKTKLYSKYGKLIANAAKDNPDINGNLTLKRLVDKAKSEQVPGDVIKRAIDKAKSNDMNQYTSTVYEVLGPSGSMFIITALTDNNNRTISDIRAVVNKTKTKIATTGSLLFRFNHVAVVSISNVVEDEITLKLLETDFPILSTNYVDNVMYVYIDITNLSKLLEILGSEYEVKDEIIYESDEYVDLSDTDLVTANLLLNLLNELDDVEEVFHNVNNI